MVLRGGVSTLILLITDEEYGLDWVRSSLGVFFGFGSIFFVEVDRAGVFVGARECFLSLTWFRKVRTIERKGGPFCVKAFAV